MPPLFSGMPPEQTLDLNTYGTIRFRNIAEGNATKHIRFFWVFFFFKKELFLCLIFRNRRTRDVYWFYLVSLTGWVTTDISKLTSSTFCWAGKSTGISRGAFRLHFIIWVQCLWLRTENINMYLKLHSVSMAAFTKMCGHQPWNNHRLVLCLLWITSSTSWPTGIQHQSWKRFNILFRSCWVWLHSINVIFFINVVTTAGVAQSPDGMGAFKTQSVMVKIWIVSNIYIIRMVTL